MGGTTFLFLFHLVHTPSSNHTFTHTCHTCYHALTWPPLASYHTTLPFLWHLPPSCLVTFLPLDIPFCRTRAETFPMGGRFAAHATTTLLVPTTGRLHRAARYHLGIARRRLSPVPLSGGGHAGVSAISPGTRYAAVARAAARATCADYIAHASAAACGCSLPHGMAFATANCLRLARATKPRTQAPRDERREQALLPAPPASANPPLSFSLSIDTCD